jgi:hypothetical protein
VLASFIGEMIGAKNVPMQFKNHGKNVSLTIPGLAEAEITMLEGQGGQPITIVNHPLCIAPGEPVTVARSGRFRLKDFGFDWNMSGRNGFRSAFAYSSS